MGQAHVRSHSAVALGLVLAGTLLAWCPSVFALDPALDVSQYAHTAWRIRDGFTKGRISSIAQTPDGYLWLGTEFGLYRFDGVRAVPWQPPAGEQLPSNLIRDLLVARDGTLWIGTERGLASWKNSKLTQYPEVAEQIIVALLQDREGTVWVGLAYPGRLCATQGERLQCYGTERFARSVSALCEDHKGNLWIAAETGLWRWAPSPPEHYPILHLTGSTHSLIEGDNGTLLVVTSDGLKRFASGTILNDALRGVNGKFRVDRLFRSSDGSLWVGTLQGLLHLHKGRADTFGAADGLSGDIPATFFEDREGSVWVSTLDGLDRFREYASPRISTSQGLSGNQADSVQATPDGAIWIGTTTGLNRWENGHVTVYGVATALSHKRTRDARGLSYAAVTEVNAGLAGVPRSLGQDDAGRLWASTTDGVYYFDRARFIRISGIPRGDVFGIIGDGHGKVWISHGDQGLFYGSPGDVAQQIPLARFGQKNIPPRALLPDPLYGGVWLGFFEGGVSYWKNGEVRASYTRADGLGAGGVNDLRFGSRGTLWAATDGGLSRIKDGHVITLTSKNGLPCDEVHWSAEDDDHFVWLYMPCGLTRIARSEMDAWVSDLSRKLKLTIFDTSDGVRNIALYGGYGPHMTKSPDGKIWFVLYDGVSVIDPRHLPFNKVPPPVHVEQIDADGVTYDAASYANERVPLSARIRDLQIDYTALSFVAPEKVRFRYKLEGLDRDWHDAGNRRQAFYTNLRPRNYRFRVMACNNSGVWNEEDAFLDFSIDSAYYQTMWFRALCVAAFLALLWALHQLRLRRVGRDFNMQLEGRVSERTRVARELHDTLLQSFQGLLMRFQAVSNELVEGEPKQELDAAIDRAAQAITEGRDAVQGLRSSVAESNNLAAALGTLGKELAAADSRPPEFTLQVEGTQRGLHPILRDEAYRVAGEALRNAFRHAEARRIEVEIRYDERQFRLRVRDDGKGIDPKLLAGSEPAGHFGLRGMRERVQGIGGKLTVWSSDPRTDGRLESGTEVELSVPAAHAYTRSRARRRSWLAKKFAGKDL